MLCEKCKTEYDGDLCPCCNLGKNNECNKVSKLLGFRSNKLWKKILSVIYFVFGSFYVLISFTTIESTNEAIVALQELLLFISPYVCLSNYKLRNYLPLFKERQKTKSIVGLVVVYILIIAFCALINPATYCEHSWVEIERVDATCSSEGSIEYSCESCGKENVEYIDILEHSFASNNKNDKSKKCLICGEIIGLDGSTTTNKKTTEETSEKNTHSHTWVEATCTKAKKCSECGESKGKALGHTTDCGVCSRCNKEFRKESPITIVNWTYEIDTAGGVEWNFNIRNNTDKEIKYVNLQWDCYNAVGDIIYDEISWKPYVKVRFTGPLEAYATSGRKRNTTKFYNYNLASYKLTKASIEYMDGTIEELNEYYDGIIE